VHHGGAVRVTTFDDVAWTTMMMSKSGLFIGVMKVYSSYPTRLACHSESVFCSLDSLASFFASSLSRISSNFKVLMFIMFRCFCKLVLARLLALRVASFGVHLVVR
jgi:hypothetical protein